MRRILCAPRAGISLADVPGRLRPARVWHLICALTVQLSRANTSALPRVRTVMPAHSDADGGSVRDTLQACRMHR